MTQIFISYCREDIRFAEIMIEAIRANLGVDCWIDEKDMVVGSEEWIRQMERAIRDSFALILIATTKALSSQWVLYEWIFALGVDIPVMSVEFEDDLENEWRKDELWGRLGSFHRVRYDGSKFSDQLFSSLRNALLQKQGAIIAPPGSSPFIRNAVNSLNGTDEEEWKRTITLLENSEDTNASIVLKATAQFHHTRLIRQLAVLAHAEHSNGQDVYWPSLRDAALSPGNSEIQQHACRILGKIGNHEAVELLAEALRNETKEGRRREIIEMLGFTARNGNSYALRFLAEHLPHISGGSEKQAFIVALRHFKTEDAAQLLIDNFNDMKGQFLELLVRSLIEIGTKNAISTIMDYALSLKDAYERTKLASHLRLTESELALPIMYKLKELPQNGPTRTTIAGEIERLEFQLRNKIK